MTLLPTADNPVTVIQGDCLEVLATLPDGSVDAVVTDPPYGLVEPRSGGSGAGRPTGVAFCPRTEETKAARRGGFMGKAWDAAVPGVDVWSAALRVLKPGGYMLAMGGTRTYHRLAVAVEDAGFEVRDCLMWLHGQGFPKGKGCLKPAYEPILLARRPGPRVLPLGVDECRVGTSKEIPGSLPSTAGLNGFGERTGRRGITAGDDGRNPNIGRWPANVVHDGSDEVLEAFAAFGDKDSHGDLKPYTRSITPPGYDLGMAKAGRKMTTARAGDTGTAARFFYTAKASRAERGEGNTHPTVKPLALMRWLVRLVTPPGGTVLDPFAGSGTTGLAALAEGRRAVLIEREPAYCDIIRRRLAEAAGPLFAGVTP